MMSPQHSDSLRRELQQMRAESAAAHTELRREMQAGFARLEDSTHRRLDNHGERLRALEIERGRLAGWLAALAAAFGGASGFLSRFLGGE